MSFDKALALIRSLFNDEYLYSHTSLFKHSIRKSTLFEIQTKLWEAESNWCRNKDIRNPIEVVENYIMELDSMCCGSEKHKYEFEIMLETAKFVLFRLDGINNEQT